MQTQSEQPKSNTLFTIAITALGTIVAFVFGLLGLMYCDSKQAVVNKPANTNHTNIVVANRQPTALSKSPEPKTNQTIAKSTPQPAPTIEPKATPVIDLKIKGNKNSMIYHLPGCASYDRIAPSNIEWFKTKEEAEAAGYRMARNC